MSLEQAGRGDAGAIWQAGDLRVDVGLQRVERAGIAVELPKLSFDLLLALMESAPHFVSNDELMTRVWKNLIVSPETVTQRVKLLRDALGDDPKSPRYIEGLRGRGYRLIPEPRRGSPPAPASTPSASAPSPATSPAATSMNMAGWRWTVPALVLLMLFAGIALWMRRPDPSVQAGQPEPATARTAAILSFESSEPDSLGAGLADSIAAQLSDVQGLTVISRYSTSSVDTGQLAPAELGAKLGAAYLVQGRLQRQGPQLRAMVSLLDSRIGQQVWTQQYTRDAGDFFGLQDEVAGGVKRALESRIAGLDPGLPPMVRSSNREAWLAYLRGRTLLGRTTVAGSEAAAREFEQSLALDPDFVPAIAALYDTRMQTVSLRRGDLDAARASNAPLLARARQLDRDSGAVQLAEAMWSPEPPERRIAGFEAGLARDPANARAMTQYSELLDELDRRDEARRWLEKALRVDPLWPRAHFRYAQRSFPVVGAAVVQQNLRTLELDPLYYPALQRHAKYHWMHHGETAYAISVIEQAIASDPENPWAIHTAIAFCLDAGEPDEAETLARLNDVADASTRALRALYRGDWKTAGEAAYAAGSYKFGKPERWLVPAAIRDHALHTGQYARAMEFLSARYDLAGDAPWTLSTDNFREAQLYAHLLLASGQQDRAMRRLDEVIAWIDANAYYGPVFNLRTRAQALALKGDADAALEELQRSFEAKDHTFWWYTLRWDPTWEALRGDSRFARIAEAERAAARAEQEQIARLRAEGRIPARVPGLTSPSHASDAPPPHTSDRT